MSDEDNGSQPYRLPYLPFSEYDDVLKEESTLCVDIPLEILQTCCIYKMAIMNIIGVGTGFWKTCHNMLSHGPSTNGLEGNSNATKSYMTDTLDILFTTIKELSEPVATLIVRNKTATFTNVKLKNDEIGIHYLPPYMSKRRLYERYCYKSGYVAKLNSFGQYSFPERTDDEWIQDDDIVMDVLAWWKFHHQWKPNHAYFKIRKPGKDICQLCFRFSQYHKSKLQSNENISDSDTSDDDDDNQYDELGMSIGIIQQIDHEMNCCENSIIEAAEHVADARNMRKYAIEKIALYKSTINHQRHDKVLTLVCVYSQNGEIPSFESERPGEVYHFSPLSIYIFGIVDIHKDTDKLTSYCYDKGVGRKGGNIVASLLMKNLRDTVGLLTEHSMKELNIIMDNCAGQNKNKMVFQLAA